MAFGENSPNEIGSNVGSFEKFTYILIGLYGWEWFISLGFDYKIIALKQNFKWSFIIYFLNRYATLVGMIIYGVVLSVRGPSDSRCNTLWTVIQTMGHLSIGTANIMLSMRVMVVWKHNLFVVIGLSLIILGYWGVLLRDIVIFGARWEDGIGCVITIADKTYVMGVFIYAMILDLLILCLMASKTGIRLDKSTKLINILLIDGLLYFILAFAVSLMAVIFSTLDLDPVATLAGWVPSVIVTSIAACRAVRHLTDFAECDEIESSRSHIRSGALNFHVSMPQRTQTYSRTTEADREIDTENKGYLSKTTPCGGDDIIKDDQPQSHSWEAV